MMSGPPGAIHRAVILSAGKGSRLLPRTEHRPKCLLELSGRTLLDRQLDALEEAGIDEVIVVTGFRDDLIDRELAARTNGRAKVRTLFNPFYHVAENLGSVWMAREFFTGDLLLLNGDTLVTAALIRRVIENAKAGINVAVDRKSQYDVDDMKVQEVRGRLVRIGKTLTPDQTTGEAIGLIAFRDSGSRAFIDMVEQLMHTPDGTARWYLRAIDRVADAIRVATLSIEGLEWAEVDYPADYESASALAARWDEQAAARALRNLDDAASGWTAVVLAGDRPGGDPLARELGVSAKAMLPLLGEPMVNHVVHALLATAGIERVVILAQRPDVLKTAKTEWMESHEGVSFRPSGDGICASIEAVAGTRAAPWPVLITTADHPLLTPEIIADFLTQAGTRDVAVGAVARDVVLSAYPQTSRTWLRFRDGAYSGANLFALTSAKAAAALRLGAEAEADRKHAYRLFWHFGPVLAVQAIARRISFDAAFARASGKLGLDGVMVPLHAAEAAIDVDKLSDLRLVEKILQERSSVAEPSSRGSVPQAAYG